MRFNILFGGEAGQGPNILTHLIGESLIKLGQHVFYSRDYQSLIRGGHNFNVLTFSDQPTSSNDSKIDILVALDNNTKELHKNKLKENSVILEGKHPNMYFAGRIFKLLCLNFKILENELKNLEKRFDENLEEAKKGYEKETQEICKINPQKNKFNFRNGNQGISEGAIKSELDFYYAYPMTPATSVLTELAQKQKEGKHLTLELENEIAVINAAIGSAMTGAKTMVGTSGGGFDLMTESISLTGIAEIPLVIYLSQRPGPGTGVATYTAQGDLNIARHSGHGEFSRVVLAPGNPTEAEELTNQAFYFAQKFKIPTIIISDKHLSESFYTIENIPKIIPSKKTVTLTRFNSYEKDANGSATENPKIIKSEVERRHKKINQIQEEAKKFKQYKIFGKEDSENVILSWGSPKGAILDAIKKLDVKFIQVLYIEPFPEIKNEIENKNLILIENNSTGQLANVLTEKTGIFIKENNKILRYDGRPFLADELRKEIEEKLK